MIYRFKEVLNDLFDYFILGDILLLKSYQNKNGLPDDLAMVFTTSVYGDNVVSEGVILPMKGIVNYPYNIIFNLSNDTPELLKDGNSLQIRCSGYSIKVENNILMLFTWRILSQFTDEHVRKLIDLYRQHDMPFIELENGWYNVEILGGETLQNQEVKNVNTGEIVHFSDFEPTFEFVLVRTDAQEKGAFDVHFNYSIKSSVY